LRGVGRGLWQAAATPFVPLAGGLTVVVLAALDLDLHFLPVLQTPDGSRDFLGLLWQVEGAVLALLVAAALFAFEGLTRSRPELSVWGYAERSGLLQYVMLASTGLIGVLVVLMWSDGRPPLLATHVAVLASALGLAALPFVLSRAARVVQPSWLRDVRLSDVRRAVADLVDADALERAALIELEQVTEGEGYELTLRRGLTAGKAVEVAGQGGAVWDIDLGRLRKRAERAGGRLRVATRLGEQVWEQATLIESDPSPERSSRKAACFLAVDERRARMDRLLAELNEEGFQAIRSESVVAISAIADTYVELWLAWPRAWKDYGQRAAAGLMRRVDPFQIGPEDEINRHLWSLVHLATERGLEEHVLKITGLIFRIGREAVELEATDILSSVMQLAQSMLSRPSPDERDLHVLINDQVCRFQVELCDYAAGPRLRDDELSSEQHRRAGEALRILYRSIAESMKLLFGVGEYERLTSLDKAFAKVLDYWQLGLDQYRARLMTEKPERFGASEADLAIARRTLELHELRDELIQLRRTYRLSVLAWILRAARTGPLDERSIRLVHHFLDTLGASDEVIQAVGLALSDERGVFSEWIIFDQEERAMQFVDTDGDILEALALYLLSRRDVVVLTPAGWMTDERISRTGNAVDRLSASETYRVLARLSTNDAVATASRVRESLHVAMESQHGREEASLIAQPIDKAKVDRFRRSVISGWSDKRLLPALRELTGATIMGIPLADWGDERFGIAPRLEPKGLFVTPSNWAGLEHHGTEFGRNLADGEVDVIMQQIVQNAPKVRGKGTTPQRLRRIIEGLQADGYAPSLVLIPVDWQLSQSLKLPEWGESTSNEGPLGWRRSGSFDDLPVVEWYSLPKDRLFAVDLGDFIAIEDGIDADGHSLAPVVDVDPIDEQRADDIISKLSPESDQVAEDVRRRRVMTSVSLRIRRPYRIRLKDSAAARSVWIPRSASDRSLNGDQPIVPPESA
jgi:hypothetical protein